LENAVLAKTSREARLDALLLRQEVEDFNAAYAAALDEQRLSDWAEMFTDDAFYVVISRENADRGMPVGLIYCENKGMIFDDKTVVVGSQNWSTEGVDSNRDASVAIQNPQMAAYWAKIFDNDWQTMSLLHEDPVP
jgi:3-phenylpropionate/cinnamic acid dioxygenase small subunit